jgi:hypothetical protein
MTRLSVSKWVAKALAVGPMAALKDSYHRPKGPTIDDDAKAWVVHLACSKPKELGYAAEVWSRQALAKHVREHAVEAVFLRCRGRRKPQCIAFSRNSRCTRKRSSITWNGAILI